MHNLVNVVVYGRMGGRGWLRGRRNMLLGIRLALRGVLTDAHPITKAIETDDSLG